MIECEGKHDPSTVASERLPQSGVRMEETSHGG